MKTYRKRDLPVDRIRRYLEPGPIVLVSSAWKDETDIMTMGWHMMLGFEPALFACYIWEENHSYRLIKRSKQCVINLPATDLTDIVIGIGNSSGADTGKFAHFGLTPVRGSRVDVPLIRECYANFECRLYDGSRIGRHGIFIWEVVKAHVAVSPRVPETLHYRGDGQFMVSGKEISRRGKFKPQNL